MFKKTFTLFLAGLLVCLLLGGCAAKMASAEALVALSWDAAAAEPEYLTQWPDNAFTQKIPQPQSGTVDYVLDHSASGRYAIFCKDISAAESAQYVQALRDAGYTALQSAESTVSAGTILARDDAYLSVSYADDTLGIVITLQKNAK